MATNRRRRLNGAATSLVALPGVTLGLLAALPPTAAHAQAPGPELKITSPHQGDGLDPKKVTLEVAFRSRTKSPVVSTELWVDGERWANQTLKSPQFKNTLKFEVAVKSFTEGTHDVVVKVFCANGVSSETMLQIAAGGAVAGADSNTSSAADNTIDPNIDPAGELVQSKPGGPEIGFQTPLNGRHVQGSVELVLDAPKKNGFDPYVTIYVDRQFKTLKNYPPYTYTWDSTTVSNGFHTIEATGYLDSSQASTTRRLKVYVDNPGGNTNVQKDVPDLNNPAVPSAAGSTVSHPTGLLQKHVVGVGTAISHAGIARSTRAEEILRPQGEPVVSADGLASVDAAATVRSLGYAESHAVAVKSPITIPGLSLSAPKTESSRKIEPVHTVAAHHNARHTAIAASIKPAAPAVTEITAPGEVSAASFATIAAPSLAIKPSAALMTVAPVTGPSFAAATHANHLPGTTLHTLRPSSVIQVIAPSVASLDKARVPMAMKRNAHHHTSLADLHPVIRPSAGGMLDIADGTPFQVAFDGQRIAFDVPPRVEAGLPLAPFRQIFEHTGGQVEWHPQGQVVRAINADREIVITVGQSTAQVNGQTMTMDRAAFIDRGRTIVPLSFVGQALDVKVKYDPATGHLEINSK